MSDKTIGEIAEHFTKEGEKKAPVKSIKLKVKFQDPKKEALEKKKKGSRE